MKIHELKIWPEYFIEIIKGNKTFEIRKNDRNYNVGDKLILNEYHPLGYYTEKKVEAQVTYITNFGLQENYVCMGIKLI